MIRRMLTYLKHLFDTPSAFYDDWKAYTRNVVLHSAAVGLLMVPLEALPYGFFIAGAAYAAWELGQYLLRKAPRADCFEDWAFVNCGAYAWSTQDWRVALIALAFLISGAMWRADNLKV